MIYRDSDDELLHYGTPRHSGRYPWGSGKNPNQHSGDILSRTDEMKRQGMSEKQIADALGLTTTQLRVQKSLAKDERRAMLVEKAKTLRSHGMSLSEIATEMGFNNDSSVRTLLNPDSEKNMNQTRKTADFLKKQVDEKGMIDIGAGVERELNISKEKLKEALYMLELEGYPTYGGRIDQVTNAGKKTTLKVLCPPGTEHKEIFAPDVEIKSIGNYVSRDGGMTFDTFHYPTALDGKRLQIVYGDQGGVEKDGLIEIRRGCKDLDLGNSRYAQVRIMVDGKSVGADSDRYLKGMCIYSDDLPKGVDIRFNTNKKSNVPVSEVLKPIKKDPDNPFGSLIKAGGQSFYDDPNGKFTDPITGKKQSLGLINKARAEGDWEDWSKKVPSQFLAKQNMSLIKQQLNLTIKEKVDEYNEIKSLTNPVVKKALLKSFSDDCDSSAIHLKAAALPRQRYQVLLPIKSLKDNEVYAPNFKNGEKIALVRFPHGGTFEIPVLTVNNKHKDANRIMGGALDAIGINSKVAERLSGADFDGDAALCIPTNKKTKITSTSPLKGLEGFDSKSYIYSSKKVDKDGKEHYYDANGKEFRKMNNTQTEMGKISNLITDMTIKGATTDELARAVRHSMVVIDAEKHKLNYKQSEVDNDIKELKNKYQGHYNENGKWSTGASTLLSRAKGEVQVEKRKGSPIINTIANKGKKDSDGNDLYDPSRPEGALLWKKANETYINSKGIEVPRTQKSTKMYETDDARTLSSGTKQEEAYADFANKLKALGNDARKEILKTPKMKYSAEAKAKYINEFNSLDAKLKVSEMNAPKERQAQIIANSVIKAKKQDNPDLTKAEIKKISQQALNAARNKVGAKSELIEITPKEWEAIQAGAISENKLKSILANSDPDSLRQKAMPKKISGLTNAQVARIRAMNNSNFTINQIAEKMNVSPSVVSKYLKGAD